MTARVQILPEPSHREGSVVGSELMTSLESMSAFTLVRGEVVDPVRGFQAVADLCVLEGKVKWIRPPGSPPEGEVVAVDGLVVCPGLVDIHVHLREPGYEHKETVASGTQAAVAGGFTTVCAMPNTSPAIDRPERVARLQQRIDQAAQCRVGILGAATVDNQREQLSDFGALLAAGCVGITDDAASLQSLEQMRAALQQLSETHAPFLAHLEAEYLSQGAAINQGKVSERLGLAGQDPRAEVEGLRQWAQAAEGLDARLHLLHLNTAEGVQCLRELKGEGRFASLSAETAPHYFCLTEEAVLEFGADAKMNPPLRTEADRQAIKQAVIDGTIEVIATDHAPHTPEEKAQGLQEAPFGVVGLETCLALVLTHLVHAGDLSLMQALAKMTCNPAQLLNLSGGTLTPGSPADIAIIDLDKSWVVEPAQFYSKGRNTPFAGASVKGQVWGTIVGGRFAKREGELLAARK